GAVSLRRLRRRGRRAGAPARAGQALPRDRRRRVRGHALACVDPLARPAGRAHDGRAGAALRGAAPRVAGAGAAALGRPGQAAGAAYAAAVVLPRDARRDREGVIGPGRHATRTPRTHTSRTTGCPSSSFTRTRSARKPATIAPRSCRPQARAGLALT